MTEDSATLAQQLLDAQTDWVVAELSGSRFDETVARDVADVLAVAATLRLGDVVSADAVKLTARRLVDVIGGSPVLADLVPVMSDAVYTSDAGDEHRLGDVVARDGVEALVAKALAMHQLQDRAMERFAESPLVATIATRYVTKIVSDFLQANREQAEKLPGVSSLFSVGLGAASKVRGAADKRLGGLLGDAQSRSTQFAIKRSNGAMREILRDAPVQEAAMQIWDLQADEAVSALREYLTAADLREVLAMVHELLVGARGHALVGALLDDCVDAFFEQYGSTDLASLLAQLGLTPEVLVEDIRRFAPPVIQAAEQDGRLHALVRARLEPFYAGERAQALLAGAPPKRPQPMKDQPTKDQTTKDQPARDKPAKKG